jgi:hypothetical protein
LWAWQCGQNSQLYASKQKLVMAHDEHQEARDVATLSKRSNTVTSFTLIEGHSAAVANDNTVSARILGNLTSYFPFPDLSVGFMFLMRGQPINGRNWENFDLVILPDHMTSVDGRSCDKVGTSWQAFKYASPASDGLSMHRDLL